MHLDEEQSLTYSCAECPYADQEDQCCAWLGF
jgi:hypothetical protein